MSADQNAMQLGAALGDLLMLVEDANTSRADLVAAVQALAGIKLPVPVVNVAAAVPPVINVAAANAPQVSVTPQINVASAQPVVHLMEPSSRRLRIKIGRDVRGFIETLDIEPLPAKD